MTNSNYNNSSSQPNTETAGTVYSAAIQPKMSNDSSVVPSAEELITGEIAVNTADGKLFVKHTDGSIKEISGSGGAAGSGPSLDRTTETVTTDADGLASFTEIGRSGVFASLSSSVGAWITLYSSASARTADQTRTFSEDPALGSGVLLEVLSSAGEDITVTPGTPYFNDSNSATDVIYAKARTVEGTSVSGCDITAKAYPISAGDTVGMSVLEIQGIAAASTDFADFKSQLAGI